MTTRSDRRGIAPPAVPFTRPDIGDDEIAAVVRVLRSGWLTTGPVVKEFEAQFATAVGSRYAVAVNSGTAALHLALEAGGVSAGDEVIIPTFTFAATGEVVRYLGARPVLVDVQREDLTIDVDAVIAACNSKTKAVIGVDMGGQPCDWGRLRDLSTRRNLFLVDDAAHALPSSSDGRMTGGYADMMAFSFYATKPITTAEGGMLTTDNEGWAARAELMSLHGISRGAWRRYSHEGTWRYEILAPGFKYNMTDIAAALGIVQLRRSSAMRERRAAIAATYTAELARLGCLEPPSTAANRTTSWHLYMIRLNLDSLTLSRDEFIDELKKRGIGASVHFIPLHLHPFYRDAYGYQPSDFPVAYHEFERVVSLPLYSTMSDEDVARVVDAVTEICGEHGK